MELNMGIRVTVGFHFPGMFLILVKLHVLNSLILFILNKHNHDMASHAKADLKFWHL